MYRCDPSLDLPSAGKRKRIIFYAKGLKIYGEIPYILRRKLKAEFFSNSFHNGQFGVIASASEMNYSVVPYGQSAEKSRALLDWLFGDAGFEWAIAIPEEFHIEIWQSTVCSPGIPKTWVPAQNSQGWQKGFKKAMAQGNEQFIRRFLL